MMKLPQLIFSLTKEACRYNILLIILMLSLMLWVGGDCITFCVRVYKAHLIAKSGR